MAICCVECTFIILSRKEVDSTDVSVRSPITGMCGDVNIFLNDDDDPTSGEIEIMIARASPHFFCSH